MTGSLAVRRTDAPPDGPDGPAPTGSGRGPPEGGEERGGRPGRQVRAGGGFHVEETGEGPVVLLLHGTGASAHSFAALAPDLAARFRVVALDLPGHGLSGPLPSGRMTLPGMAGAVADCLDVLGAKPDVVVGHSAGAAIALRMCLDRRIRPRVVVSLNGALKGFRGPVGRVFSPLARLLAGNPLVPRLFARRARDASVVDGLVDRTGSRLGPREIAHYRRLARDPAHVAAALSMMAGWDLASLGRELPRLDVPVLLVAGSRDGMVPPEQVFDLARILPDARAVVLPGLGHLAHEEAPETVSSLIEAAAREHGVLPEAPS